MLYNAEPVNENSTNCVCFGNRVNLPRLDAKLANFAAWHCNRYGKKGRQAEKLGREFSKTLLTLQTLINGKHLPSRVRHLRIGFIRSSNQFDDRLSQYNHGNITLICTRYRYAAEEMFQKLEYMIYTHFHAILYPRNFANIRDVSYPHTGYRDRALKLWNIFNSPRATRLGYLITRGSLALFLITLELPLFPLRCRTRSSGVKGMLEKRQRGARRNGTMRFYADFWEREREGGKRVSWRHAFVLSFSSLRNKTTRISVGHFCIQMN